jgi:hypothetical protein
MRARNHPQNCRLGARRYAITFFEGILACAVEGYAEAMWRAILLCERYTCASVIIVLDSIGIGKPRRKGEARC